MEMGILGAYLCLLVVIGGRKRFVPLITAEDGKNIRKCLNEERM